MIGDALDPVADGGNPALPRVIRARVGTVLATLVGYRASSSASRVRLVMARGQGR